MSWMWPWIFSGYPARVKPIDEIHQFMDIFFSGRPTGISSVRTFTGCPYMKKIVDNNNKYF